MKVSDVQYWIEAETEVMEGGMGLVALIGQRVKLGKREILMDRMIM